MAKRIRAGEVALSWCVQIDTLYIRGMLTTNAFAGFAFALLIFIAMKQVFASPQCTPLKPHCLITVIHLNAQNIKIFKN